MNISEFPPEILSRIFSFLGPTDLLQCRLVDQTFCQAASDDVLWKAIEARMEQHLRQRLNPGMSPWIFNNKNEPRFRHVVRNALIGLDYRRHRKPLFKYLKNTKKSNLFHIACSVRFPFYFKQCTCGRHGHPWTPQEFDVGCYTMLTPQPCYWIPSKKSEIRTRKKFKTSNHAYRTESLPHFLYPYLSYIAPFRTSCNEPHKRNHKRKRDSVLAK